VKGEGQSCGAQTPGKENARGPDDVLIKTNENVPSHFGSTKRGAKGEEKREGQGQRHKGGGIRLQERIKGGDGKVIGGSQKTVAETKKKGGGRDSKNDLLRPRKGGPTPGGKSIHMLKREQPVITRVPLTKKKERVEQKRGLKI